MSFLLFVIGAVCLVLLLGVPIIIYLLSSSALASGKHEVGHEHKLDLSVIHSTGQYICEVHCSLAYYREQLCSSC